MLKILNLYKEIGETPLERLDRFKLINPEYVNTKLSYLGRLDPVAEGVMIVAVGEENKNREAYLGLDKVYEVDILFGIQTDTGDILGLAQDSSVDIRRLQVDQKTLEDVVKSFVGKRMQKYPSYSSKTVGGKPMFMWAREDRLEEIETLEKEVEIYKIDLLKMGEISRKDFLAFIQKRIALVKGDFRQGEILEKWGEVLEFPLPGQTPSHYRERALLRGSENAFQTTKILVSSGSGTYMRILAKEIGDTLGVSAMAIGIKRVSAGEWNIKNSLK